jgi:DNA/RNA non-specific endonuclease
MGQSNVPLLRLSFTLEIPQTAEHLTLASLGKSPLEPPPADGDTGDRGKSTFQEDESLPVRFRAKLQDYFRSGYDRGHMCVPWLASRRFVFLSPDGKLCAGYQLQMQNGRRSEDLVNTLNTRVSNHVPRRTPWTRRFYFLTSLHKLAPASIATVRLRIPFPLVMLTTPPTHRLGLSRRLVSPVDELVLRCLRVHHSVVSPSQGIRWEVAGRKLSHTPATF